MLEAVEEYVHLRKQLEHAIAEREQQYSSSGSIRDAKQQRVNTESVEPARLALDIFVASLMGLERDQALEWQKVPSSRAGSTRLQRLEERLRVTRGRSHAD